VTHGEKEKKTMDKEITNDAKGEPAVASTALLAAAEPFRRALEIMDALPPEFRPADNSALRECLPGIWPTVGELREIINAIFANTGSHRPSEPEANEGSVG